MALRLVVVSHTPSPNTERLTRAVAEGARHPDIDGVEVRVLVPLDAGPDDVLGSDGIILGTTENFGYMAGRLKDFLERIYYPCLEKTPGLPYALFVKGGQDGTGAKSSVERIVTGLRWKPIQPALVMAGAFQDDWLDNCRELGATMAAGLEAGVF